MSVNNAELITIACPYCGKKYFSFSPNALTTTKGIQIVCPGCELTISISETDDGELFIQTL